MPKLSVNETMHRINFRKHRNNWKNPEFYNDLVREIALVKLDDDTIDTYIQAAIDKDEGKVESGYDNFDEQGWKGGKSRKRRLSKKRKSNKKKTIRRKRR
jgi:hypothetical protein